MSTHRERLVSTRVDLPDQTAARDLLIREALEYYGVLHQRDRWFEMGPNGGGLLVREQSLGPPCLIEVRRPLREPVGIEEQLVTVLGAMPDGESAVLPPELEGRSEEEVILRGRELWLLRNIRLNLDVVQGCGIFLTIEAVQDDAHPEAGARRDVDDLLSEMGVEPDALVPYSYAELIRSRRSEPRPDDAELEEIRRRNFEEVRKRMVLLRAVPGEE